MPLRIPLLIALAVLAGSGCGRRGALERPDAAVEDPRPTMPGALDDASPGAQQPQAVRPGDAAPRRRFVLDPLI